MKVISIPESTSIHGSVYEVRLVAQSPLDDNLAGRIDHYNQTIRLLDVGTDYKERTYLHEILHGIDRYTNSELSEAQVEQISSGLFTWLVENGLQITGKE